MTPLVLLLGCTNKAAAPSGEGGGTDCTPALVWRDGDGDDDCDGLPGRCETVGEVRRAEARAILVGDEDTTLHVLGTSIASPTEPGKRPVVLP